ncbi:sigma-54 dependent transcriptional regulator [Capnocytophaga ochracea]|jgi:two component, sigma54 specific, transcriptional regulator, fis family|uniref:Sigma-54 dependent transcriptional regulator n=3 Tax=Capnocytophaga ochracea TaxID=1018 RepID=A0A7Z8YER4_CAPOC|nr:MULTISPECIES: sigma-54 dependent transcriptional regulator [Capnocytophaga]ALC98131.1 chemotaxis protein CheY [Capnocytophaga sp. oral taxon 323]AVM55052.1 sigma-54-dependent Fis family transcriptional regulator [Capnocytophaga sp. oral taxon 864]EFS98686.1 Sigma-54 interaction domain protein [Capnocytophaga ochracea F0287]EIW93435.1 putative transcriptional regulatory protein ZraR [Capnocytophaga sp. oral taxon 412 str. F0487]EJF35015.1 putative transcriptional regulatory protein ZraR [Cap
MKNPILLVEDDVVFSKMLGKFLERNGYEVVRCYNLEEAEKSLNASLSLVFTDLRLPDGDGINFLKKVKEVYPDLPVVVMTSYAEVSTAVEAMKLGAFDYISKPFQQEDVLNVIKNAQSSTRTASLPKKENVKADNSPGKAAQPVVTNENSYIEGVSAASKKLNKFISLVAPTDMSVLITGESGTGKEVIAKSIHLKSERRNKPFIAVDCGAIPKEIASSEFFGHVKGSFTGAITDKKGHFEEANGGTIFLDEVGNLSYDNQIQLLRALQERRIKPIGSSKEIEVDIRVLAATNEDLLAAVGKGEFREDLYHRLNEFSIKVPSLSERKDDLMIFASYFLEKANEKLHKNVQGFTEKAVQKMLLYTWGGNLRELSNTVKRAALLTQGDYITENELPEPVITETRHFPTERFSFSTKENERELIISALHETHNNKTEAAKLLGFTRKTLYNKLKAYNIDEF